MIRSMGVTDFKTLCELPIVKQHLPFFRAARADFSVRVNSQDTALNFSSTALKNLEKAIKQASIQFKGKALSTGDQASSEVSPWDR